MHLSRAHRVVCEVRPGTGAPVVEIALRLWRGGAQGRRDSDIGVAMMKGRRHGTTAHQRRDERSSQTEAAYAPPAPNGASLDGIHSSVSRRLRGAGCVRRLDVPLRAALEHIGLRRGSDRGRRV